MAGPIVFIDTSVIREGKADEAGFFRLPQD